MHHLEPSCGDAAEASCQPCGVPSVPALRADPGDVGCYTRSLQREVILMLLFAYYPVGRGIQWILTCCFVDLPHLLQQYLECRAVRPHPVAVASLAFPARKQVPRVAVVRRRCVLQEPEGAGFAVLARARA